MNNAATKMLSIPNTFRGKVAPMNPPKHVPEADLAALAKLYPTGADYLKAFRASAQQAVDGGFLLGAEARTMIANAEAVAATFGS